MEAVDENPAFHVGEAPQIVAPRRMRRVGENGLDRLWSFRLVVPDDVPHHPDEDQIDRVTESFGNRHHAAIVRLVEIGEDVHATPGEKCFTRIGRILAQHGRIEHRLQAMIARFREILGSPFGQRVLCIFRHIHQFGGRALAVATVQLRDDLEIVHERPQLGGRSQIELAAFIQIERPVQVIGLDPQVVGSSGPLVEGNAVGDPARISLGQQPLADQPEPGGLAAIGQRAQSVDHPPLRRCVQRRLRLHVETIEIVKLRHAEQGQQVRPHHIRRLAVDQRDFRRGRRILPELERRSRGEVAQARRNHVRVRHQPQVGIREFDKIVVTLQQIVGGPPLREQQAQDLLVDRGRPLSLGPVLVWPLEQPVGFVQIGAVPRPQPVGQADHLTETGPRRERRRVDVIDHDPLPGEHRVRSVLVGAHARRRDLPEFVFDAAGSPFRRMAVLLDLRRQGRAAEPLAAGLELAGDDIDRGRGESIPLDRRVARRISIVEQFAIFDEQQGVHDETGNGLEVGEHPLRMS
jgi:hypothetical protein